MIFLLWELKLLPLRCRRSAPASFHVCHKIILPIFLLLRRRFGTIQNEDGFGKSFQPYKPSM